VIRQSKRLAKKAVEHLWIVLLAPIVVGLVVAVATGAWRPWQRSDILRSTSVRLFQPESEIGASVTFAHVTHDRGKCQWASDADPGIKAVHHCFGKTFNYDPCWAGFSPTVVCVGSPWAHTATLFLALRYTFSVGRGRHRRTVEWDPMSSKQLPLGQAPQREPTAPPTTAPPWALELANGERCLFLPDRTYRIEDLTQTYLCDAKGFESSGGPTGSVYGLPDRTHDPWEVQYMPEDGSTSASVPVEVAWY